MKNKIEISWPGRVKLFFLGFARDERKDWPWLILRPFLYILSLVYGLGVFLARCAYCFGVLPSYKSPLKVISVGNITLGGTGKTPLVEFLAGCLSRKDACRVAILSRGYSQDEPLSLERNLPLAKVISGRDRIKSAKEAADDFKCNTIILDDGFQHWRLKRDLDIVAINSRNPFGSGRLIPRGILREPVSSLKRADIIVITKADSSGSNDLITARLRKLAPGALIVESAHQPLYIYSPSGQKEELSCVKDKDICLLSSIADPEHFRAMALDLGARIVLNLSYPDHYDYKKEDILKIISRAKEKQIDTILTTEKDFMRIPYQIINGKIKILILKIGIKITQNEKQLFDRISGLLAG